MVRNNDTLDDMKFLGIKNKGYNSSRQIWYEEYCFSMKNGWIYEKRV